MLRRLQSRRRSCCGRVPALQPLRQTLACGLLGGTSAAPLRPPEPGAARAPNGLPRSPQLRPVRCEGVWWWDLYAMGREAGALLWLLKPTPKQTPTPQHAVPARSLIRQAQCAVAQTHHRAMLTVCVRALWSTLTFNVPGGCAHLSSDEAVQCCRQQSLGVQRSGVYRSKPAPKKSTPQQCN